MRGFAGLYNVWIDFNCFKILIHTLEEIYYILNHIKFLRMDWWLVKPGGDW
jgi:hypothetical protein